LAGGFTRSIDIEDPPLLLGAIPQPYWLTLWHQGASQQISEKQAAQGFDGLGRQSG